MAYFNDWAAFEAYLEKLGFFRMELGLERVGAALDALALRRLPCPAAQVVGTNGKGSTCTFLAALAQARGKKAVLHSSPHFVSLRERVRVFAPGGSPWGELLPEKRWLTAANAVLAAGGETLTYFELVSVIAAWLMREEGAELAVLEAGLGGRHDASSTMHADLTVFTPIALDHCAVLGKSIAEIAVDKAGAMRRGGRAVSAAQEKPARAALEAEATKLGANLDFAAPGLLPARFADGMALGIQGAHQSGNAALALAAWRIMAEKLGLESDPAAEERGLAAARLPGRMQFIQPAPHLARTGAPAHPPLIVDGAHNAHGLAALGHSLARLGIAPAAIIFNCMADKEPESLAPHLRALSTGPIFVPKIKNNPRAMPARDMAALIGLAATPVPGLGEAIRLAALSINERLPEEFNRDIHECRHPLLICGSLYLLGEFFALYPEHLAPEHLAKDTI